MIEIVLLIIAFATAITVHEVAHAFVADRLGDPTARLMGRLSLNPLVHYDKIGTTLLIITTMMYYLGYGAVPFGWAKPVQFDPYNLKDPKKDAALISLAGPLSNIIFAIILGIVLRLIQNPFNPLHNLSFVLYPIIGLNIILAFFNLIPLHPLDGAKILVGIVPTNNAIIIDRFLKKYSLILLLLLIFPFLGGRSIISLVLSPALEFALGILIP